MCWLPPLPFPSRTVSAYKKRYYSDNVSVLLGVLAWLTTRSGFVTIHVLVPKYQYDNFVILGKQNIRFSRLLSTPWRPVCLKQKAHGTQTVRLSWCILPFLIFCELATSQNIQNSHLLLYVWNGKLNSREHNCAVIVVYNHNPLYSK